MIKHMDDSCPVCNLWMPGRDHDRVDEETAICNSCGKIVHIRCMDAEYGEQCKACWDRNAEEDDCDGE